VLNADLYGSAFVVLAVILVYLAGAQGINSNLIKPERLVMLVLAGASVGAAQYFRWSTFLTIPVMVLFLLVFILVRQAHSKRLKYSHDKGETQALGVIPSPKSEVANAGHQLVKALVPLLMGWLIVVTPWTVHIALTDDSPSWQWQQASWTCGDSWQTDEQLISRGGSWLVEGRANWPCEIDPDRCAEINNVALINDSSSHNFLLEEKLKSILRNPLPFAVNRAQMWSSGVFTLPSSSPGSNDAVLFGVLNIGAFALLVALTFTWFEKRPLFFGLIWAALISQGLTLSVYHMEVRYLNTFTTLPWVALILVLPEYLKTVGVARWIRHVTE